MPDVVEVAVPLPPSDFAKAAFFVERAACVVAGHDLRLQRPVALAFGVGDHPVEQCRANPLPAHRSANVYADLSDTGGASRVRHRGEGGPAGNRAIVRTGDEPPKRQVSGVPGLPAWRVRHEGGQTGRETFAIDRAHLVPVAWFHVINGECHARGS